MRESEDSGTYRIANQQSVQGQVTGDGSTVYNYYGSVSPTPSISPPERLWTIPFARNLLFLGQEDLLTRLHSHLKQGTTTALTQAQAISGLGGIGKTQIAIEYAYRYRDS